MAKRNRAINWEAEEKDLTKEILKEKELSQDLNKNNIYVDFEKKINHQQIELEARDGTYTSNYKKVAIVQSDDFQRESPHIEPTPKRSAKKKEKQIEKSNLFKFSEASFDDMHNFRVLENERLQREHELRLKNMAELHEQVMLNLKLQEEYIKRILNK